MTIYRYAYDSSGRTFTEQEWIAQAYPHFIRAPYDTDGTFIFFLASVFEMHRSGKTIIEADEVTDKRPPPFVMVGCPICHRRHPTNDSGDIPRPTDHGPYHADHYRHWALKE